jgi:uncharacterized protein (TIGR03382 family)
MDFSKTENVLADNLPDAAGGSFTKMIQLPNVECENCTLQLIQMMYDKAPYGDGNDIYFQCADISLRAGAPPAPGGDPDPTPDPTPQPEDPTDDDMSNDSEEPGAVTGGCSTSAQDTGFATLLAIVGWIGVSGRRRRR